MQVVDVHVVCLQTLETVVDSAEDSSFREAALVSSFSHFETDLRGEDLLCPPPLQRLPEHGLRDSGLVHICSVKKVDAGINALIHHSVTRLPVGWLAERHRSKAQA